MRHILSIIIVVDDGVELCSPDRIGVFFVDFLYPLEVGAAVEIMIDEDDALMSLEGHVVVGLFCWFCLVLELKLDSHNFLLVHSFLLGTDAVIDSLSSHDDLHAGLPREVKLVHFLALLPKTRPVLSCRHLILLRSLLSLLLLSLHLFLLADDALQGFHHVAGHLVEVCDHSEA